MRVPGLMRGLHSLKYKPLNIIDVIWFGPLRFPHYIPLIKKESTGPSRTLEDRSAEYRS